MTSSQRLAQTWTIARLQLLRVFFSKRSFWVYGLALFPSIIFFGHGVEVKMRRANWSSRAVSAVVMESLQPGDTIEEVLRRAGPPVNQRRWRGRDDQIERGRMMYFDGRRRWDLSFEAGILQGRSSRTIVDFDEDRQIFAGFFQYFYLRLAIFFGCLGIFMNLFRGEMLDKTLHFWFLVPARREVLLAGKYLAGLIAATLIFTGGAALCYSMLLWPQDPAEVAAFWSAQGPSHLAWYAAAAALGCVGYGSVFLASGLLLKNPIIPAVTILFWESINGLLPAMLQKLSILYYVQSLCPVPAPTPNDAPLLIRLLMAPAEPASAASAIFGLCAVTALVLWTAARAVRRLEINYSTE
jgi:hypothetical protein